ncbi:MAG: toprim domain-containing protein [Thiotrichales bacterium]|nr:toprim domain-containing protein [Thiotrichales bacterium]
MAPGPRIDWLGIIEPVARSLLGEPSARMSTACELRYGTRGSLAVHIAGDRAGTWYDFETREGGGVLALIERERGSRAAALAWFANCGFIPERCPGQPAMACPERYGKPPAVGTSNADARPCAAQSASRGDSWRNARRVWNATRPLAGTVAKRYLDARGVGHVVGTAALRFHPALSHPNAPGRYPCLVAGVQDVSGRFLGIQRTYLTLDGSSKASVDPVRASLGSLAGGAVRLSEPVDDRLLLAEGIETTAAAVRVLGWTGGAWATLGTSGLRAVVLPAGVREVVIAADRDLKGGGQLAAAALAERLMNEGRSVAIERPPFVGDWCDVLVFAGGAI